MPWKIAWARQAVKELSKLDKKDAERIVKKLEQASENPEHYLSRLSGHEEYKLRTGNYRTIVTLRHSDETIQVENIGHRKNVYKKLK